ncbi:NPCBM/NEW2 domain-containing protein [Microbispora sp. NPDC004025]|uniref:NPCBM/NEW2 domain-containing protein n=1 Tax=Microbispora sp. NPDC049633 TaxID=3154355 RepID=UPI0034285D90
MNGTTYPQSITLKPNSPWEGANQAEYDLSRAWQTLKATVGVQDDAPADAKALVEVYGDDTLLYHNQLGLGEADTIRVSIGNVLRLKLKTTWISGDRVYSVVWGDAALEK